MLAVFSCFAMNAQIEKKDLAENLFDKYHKLGIFGGASIIFFTNEPNAVNLYYEDVKAFSYGLNYNFFQTGNFNFKVGAVKRTYHVRATEKFQAADINSPYSIAIGFSFGVFTQYLFPLTAEYFLPLGEKLSFSMGLGPEFTYYPDGTLGGGRFSHLGGWDTSWLHRRW